MRTEKRDELSFNKSLFEENLIAETDLLDQWFQHNQFAKSNLKVGAEVEFFMLDEQFHLLPQNKTFVEKLSHPNLIPEAGASQLELNSPVITIHENFLSEFHQSLATLWRDCCHLARRNHYHLALIGSIPNAEKYHSEIDYITPDKYYYLMNDNAHKYRNGQPFQINFKGEKESLFFQPDSLSIEGLISSFQLHLEIEAEHSAHYYNVMQMLSGPLLALSSNAPYFYGKNAWSESRIAVFEQLYTFPAPYENCVFFEPNYLQSNFFTLFKRNIDHYPFLIPEASSEEPPNHMFHVRRQNSYVFRWNRPIIDLNERDEPYLRIEHRPLSTGPTIIDMVANAAFFYGLVHYFVKVAPNNPLIPFQETYANFYEAAKNGLLAQFKWNNVSLTAESLLLELLPLAKKGLHQLGVCKTDSDFYLSIIYHRIIAKQNGSLWQQKFIENNGKNFSALLEKYLENQYSEIPVSEWKL